MRIGVSIEVFFALLFLGIILVGFGISIPVSYLLLRSDLDKESAKETLKSRWLSLVLVLILAILLIPGIIALVTLVSKAWIDSLFSALFLALTLWMWGHFATWPSRKRRAGPVLIDIGPLRSKSLVLLVIICIGMLVLTVYTYAEEPDEIIRIFQIASFVSLAGFEFWIGWVARAQITEKGFFLTSLIEWTRLESFEWSGSQENILTLRIIRRLSLFRFLGSRTMILRVPLELRDSVNQALVAHIPELQV